MLAALAASACTKDEPAEVPTLVASAPAPEKRGAAGSREEKPEYVVELLAPEAAASGAKRAAVVHVVAGEGFHVNVDYPMAFTPDEVDGLHFEDKKIPLTDAAEKTACRAEPKDTCEVRAKVPFTAEKAATLSGLVAFSICQSGQCLIKKVRLAVDVPPP
jgi:hypothetical protein